LRYCESKADQDGIFPFNEKIAATYVGQKITLKDLEKLPIGRLPNGKYFIDGFCFLQNGKLTNTCNAHKPVFKILEVNEIKETDLVGRLPVSLQEREKEGETGKEGEILPPPKDEKTPTKETFLAYCKEVIPAEYQSLEFSLNAKYDTWVSAGWKDGNKKKIENWKNTVRNVIPFLKPMQQPKHQHPSEMKVSNYKVTPLNQPNPLFKNEPKS